MLRLWLTEMVFEKSNQASLKFFFIKNEPFLKLEMAHFCYYKIAVNALNNK